MYGRAILAIILSILLNCASAQLRHPVTEQMVAIANKGDFKIEPGNFSNYEAGFGLINHMKSRYGLQFITLTRNDSLPWMVILNGGPGRSNLRLSFEIDSLLLHYNVLLPGYRGFDDGAYDVVFSDDDSRLQKFVLHHQSLFSTQAVADDVLLIIDALKIENYSILAHSFGTIVGRYILKSDSVHLEKLYAFSPVSEKMPFPNPQQLSKIISALSVDLNIPLKQFTDTLAVWNSCKENSYLIMGMISSFYRYREMYDFFDRVFKGDLTRSEIVRNGRAYLHREWLFDFALKFDISDPYSGTSDLYETISSLFIKALNRYHQTESSYHQVVSAKNDSRIKVFLSQFEFFYSNFEGKIVADACQCAHADIWHKAPKLVLDQY